MLGKWQETESGGPSIPVGGLAYYISPPFSLGAVGKSRVVLDCIKSSLLLFH